MDRSSRTSPLAELAEIVKTPLAKIRKISKKKASANGVISKNQKTISKTPEPTGNQTANQPETFSPEEERRQKRKNAANP